MDRTDHDFVGNPDGADGLYPHVPGFLCGAFSCGRRGSWIFPSRYRLFLALVQYRDRAKSVASFLRCEPTFVCHRLPTRRFAAGDFLVGSARAGDGYLLLEGIPAVVFGVVTLFYLTDWPHQANWLTDDERNWISNVLNQENQAKQKIRSYTIWQALGQRDVILLTCCYFCATTGGYGIAFWLPTILKRLSGQSDIRVSLFAALPYLAGFVLQQVNGWHSDREQERRWHAGLAIFLCGISLLLAVAFGSSNMTAAVILFTVVGGCYFSFHPCFWAVPTAFLTESAAAASIGLINSLGNLGGFVGPLVMGYLVHRTHSFRAGLLYLVGSLCLSGILMLAVGVGRRRVSPLEFNESQVQG